ncbi:unnamed protein product [Malus baccata var. baccata]|uniref:Glutaredoxin-like protein n=1 Tax=Malus domestica TaxID=3750 RepID=A0A498I125_MALDO|nr:hypothetical protein DVH24_042739 [Malus domestica]
MNGDGDNGTGSKASLEFVPNTAQDEAAFLLSGPDSLHDVDLQVRDITSNPEWERAYQYEIPVLARVLSDGTENPGNFPS